MLHGMSMLPTCTPKPGSWPRIQVFALNVQLLPAGSWWARRPLSPKKHQEGESLGRPFCEVRYVSYSTSIRNVSPKRPLTPANSGSALRMSLFYGRVGVPSKTLRLPPERVGAERKYLKALGL